MFEWPKTVSKMWKKCVIDSQLCLECEWTNVFVRLTAVYRENKSVWFFDSCVYIAIEYICMTDGLSPIITTGLLCHQWLYRVKCYFQCAYVWQWQMYLGCDQQCRMGCSLTVRSIIQDYVDLLWDRGGFQPNQTKRDEWVGQSLCVRVGWPFASWRIHSLTGLGFLPSFSRTTFLLWKKSQNLAYQ